LYSDITRTTHIFIYKHSCQCCNHFK